jgi:hypothetical protein
MTRSGLQRRLKALEAKSPDPTEPQKALVPAWLVEEAGKQGVRLDASGYPEKVGMESGSTSAVRRNSKCLA